MVVLYNIFMRWARIIFVTGLGIAALMILVRSLPAYSILAPDPIQTNSPEVLGIPESTPTPEASASSNLGSFHYAWVKANPETLELMSNLDSKETASDLMKEYSCSALVNAGFYTADSPEEAHEAIGLFVSEGETLSDFRKNSLFNGILSINEMDTPRITEVVPADPLRMGIQTGPLLQVNDQAMKLSLARDKNARRLVAAVTGDNELIFIVFYDSDARFSGPLLADLPQLLGEFENKTQINIADAINMDGGSASAFITDEVSLTEISPIGSFFCLK